MPEHDPPPSQEVAAWMRAEAADGAARDEAIAVIDKWNAAVAAGHGDLWSPTIGCAVVAERPYLDVHCPGCAASRAVDMRTVDLNPLATVNSLVLGLRCSLCLDGAPLAELRGLHPSPRAAKYESTL